MNGNELPDDDNFTNEQRFQLLVAAISDYAIYMLDTTGHITSWNSGAQRFKGYLEHEILGQHFSRFHTPEDRAAGLPQRALKIAEEEGRYEAEGWRVRKDGSRFWASVVIDPIRNDKGKLLGFAKVTRDITERKVRDEALRSSEEQFRMLVQGVTDYAIYMLDANGFLTNWNAGAERIKGYNSNEVVGTHFSRFYTEEDQAARIPEHALAIATREGRYEQEGWRVRKDGTSFLAHVIIDAIHNSLGELIGFAKVTRDITEKRVASDALQKANTALFQAQKMEALGQLTGGIAHDFNNLLGVVSTGIDMLSLQLHGKPRTLESMRRAVDRGAELTQHLLSFARQQPLKAEKWNLNELIGDFESVLRRAGNSSISFDIRLDPELRPVLLDATLFQTTLLNLVVNSRDALPNGGRISIHTQKIKLQDNEIGLLPPGTYARVTISDNGTGMPEHVVTRALEPFFTTKEIGKGTGLGLSQVYGFITQSGGDITINSNPGKGTEIALYLPIIEEEENEADARTRMDSNVEKVLIVEDEPDLLDVAAELFRVIGYEVYTASSAVEALDVLQRNDDVDFLFSDVVMASGMNGLELAHTVQKHYPQVKIVLTSGYPIPALKAEHKGLHNFAFINKPYQLSDVAKKFRQFA